MWINEFEVDVYGARGMYFFEPLETKAPRAGVRPYCCLVNTIYFYAYPYVATKDGSRFVDYGKCESKWHLFGERFMDGEGWQCLAPLVLHDAQVYELAIGRVVWHQGRWTLKHLGWRVRPDDWRWPSIQKFLEVRDEQN